MKSDCYQNLGTHTSEMKIDMKKLILAQKPFPVLIRTNLKHA